jgi:16S rRNA processing protein RimM
LPAAKPGEFYWLDLIGLQVINQQGVELGVVDHLMETGANDVLVVRDKKQANKEQLVPFVIDKFVKSVDLENKTILVDWDADF